MARLLTFVRLSECGLYPLEKPPHPRLVSLRSAAEPEGDPDRNVLYTTAGRLVAMVGASVFVLVTQRPTEHAVVWFMSILREGQEMFIDPLFPYANSPVDPIVDFGMHVVIVALQIAAFITVTRLARQDTSDTARGALA